MYLLIHILAIAGSYLLTAKFLDRLLTSPLTEALERPDSHYISLIIRSVSWPVSQGLLGSIAIFLFVNNVTVPMTIILIAII